MTRDEKNQLINDLKDKLNESKVIYLADNSSMTAVSDNNFRKELYKEGISMQVIKNTIIKKAVEQSDLDWGELIDTLKGTTALLFASNAKAPAVAIKEFRKKSDKPLLKGAYIESSVFVGDDQLDALIKLKSKEDLIAEIVALLQSPAKNVISALKAPSGKLAGIIKTLSEKESN